MARLLAPWRPLLLLAPLWSACLCGQPCKPGTYREQPSGSRCVPCKVCSGMVQVYLRRCSESANAICKCRPEYSCGKEPLCGKCRCESGQEQTGKGCQSCPEGTFNDLPGGKCRPWTQCPSNYTLTLGTKKTDVNCKQRSKVPTQPPTTLMVASTKLPEMDSQLISISIALIMALLLCALILLLSCIFFRSRLQGKLLKLPSHGQLAQEVDDCSYRYPEEEEGYSEATGLKGELLEKFP